GAVGCEQMAINDAARPVGGIEAIAKIARKAGLVNVQRTRRAARAVVGQAGHNLLGIVLEKAWIAINPIALHLREATVPAIAVRVAQRRQQRSMNDIKRPADEGHSLRRINPVRKDRDLVSLAVAVGVNA